MLYPLVFEPIFKERVWGGRKLEKLYGKGIPPGRPIGESWEISDRPSDISVIANGPLKGKDLHWLIENHGTELLGTASPVNGRFPLLIKILDAQDTLSLQVHPPAHKAAGLGGEAKTEMWYIAEADPHAELFVGLKRGIARDHFEEKLRFGAVAECFHRIPVRTGDAMFLPSGRVHALGAGLVIFEIQQNSDTTYRVFDWNRKGLDGKPRELHVDQALGSIDFNDFEPALVSGETRSVGAGPTATFRNLVSDVLFNVSLITTNTTNVMTFRQNPSYIIVGVVEGKVAVASAEPNECVELKAGQFCLVPANLPDLDLYLEAGSKTLTIGSDAQAELKS